MSYKRGDLVTVNAGNGHYFKNGEHVVIVYILGPLTEGFPYKAISVDSNKMDQFLSECDIKGFARKNSKYHKGVQQILDMYPVPYSYSDDNDLEPDASLEVFDPEVTVVAPIKDVMIAVFGEMDFADDHSTVTIHSIYTKRYVDNDEEASAIFEAYADDNVCTSYVIPDLFDGKIIDLTK